MPEGFDRRVVLEENLCKFDVAFSFLAKDEGLATQINDLLQDRVNTFMYSRQQEKLVGTDGEKTFSEVFGKEAPVVVVLFRNGWGQTRWTRIEETAIRGRAYEEGYDFTLFIPLDQTRTLPQWLPKTQIWFDFERWGSSGAAAIIEHKTRERGGQAREESVLDRAARLGRAIEHENRRRTFLGSSEGVQAAQVELATLCDEIESLTANEAIRALKIVHKRDILHTVLLTHNNNLGLDVSWPGRYSNTLDGAKLQVTLWKGHPPFRGIMHFENPQRLETQEFGFDLTAAELTQWVSSNGRQQSTKDLASYIVKYFMDKIHDRASSTRA